MGQAVYSCDETGLPSAQVIDIADAVFQRDVANYWDRRAGTYSNSVAKELAGESHILWRSYLRTQIPQKRHGSPRVLDLGCGPGFFDIVFAEAGCKVTAVDSSAGMLNVAQANVSAAGFQGRVRFRLADVASLPFLASGSFDLVVSRNVTWMMRDLKSAYAEWLRLLAPGGTMLAFDSNWYSYLNDSDLAARHAQCVETTRAEVSQDCLATKEQERLCEEIAAQISTTYLTRPQFDEQALRELGARSVVVDGGIWKKLWTCEEQRFHRLFPMYLIKATR